MKNFFTNLYESLLTHPKFSTVVYDSHDYVWLGVFLIIIPLFISVIFYKFWDPTPVKKWKWLVMLVFPSVTIVFGVSVYWLYTGSLQDLLINLEPGVTQYLLTLALYNAIYVIPVVLVYSFFIKRLSINNYENPFKF